MAAPRLSDDQRQELVSRFQTGDSTQELAERFGCSPNTVIRVVKAAIEPAVYEELKRQRGRRGTASAAEPDPAACAEAAEAGAAPLSRAESPLAEPDTQVAAPSTPSAPARSGVPAARPDPEDEGDLGEATAASAHEAARGLAIDDADDFDGPDEDDDDDDEDDPEFANLQAFVEVPVALETLVDQPLTTPRPWLGEAMPESVYMLVDKTVELQARPLAEIPELGPLEPKERDLRALVLYSNPRQAKRQCGRTQRVIKLPDVGVLERTAPYLLRQGIRRIVLEGTLYALPEA